MFIGHFAVGFAAKRAAPHVSLAVLFAAALLADLLWPLFLLFGLEHVLIDPGNTAFTPLDFVSYPWSHSLVMLIVWGLLFGLVYRLATRRRALPILAALVVSHWVLDWITHRPDMPLYPRGPLLGLGLWNSVGGTILVEGLLFVAGVAVYLRATSARDAIGRWAMAGFVAFLLLAYAADIPGSPPPSVTAIEAVALAGSGVLVVWAWWFDRHRVSGSSR